MSIELLDVEGIANPDDDCATAVADRAANVLRPRGALHRLDELAAWLAAWQHTAKPAVNHPALVIFAGDHGVATDGVSAYPASITAAMMEALAGGSATASVMARHLGVALHVVDVGVGKPTGNIRVEPAMSERQFEKTVEAGRAGVSALETPDLLMLGEIGIGNTTSAAAVSMALLGGESRDWVGAGSGLDNEGLAQKRRVVEEAVGRVGWSDPMDVLWELGGWELAAIAGAVIEARHRSLPVLLDGFVVTAAVMALEVAHPGYLDHCWPAHVSAEPGHRRLVGELGRQPILDLGMRLGEGSGALAALPLLSIAARSVVDVATFEEIGLT